jgi:hypothetical protein
VLCPGQKPVMMRKPGEKIRMLIGPNSSSQPTGARVTGGLTAGDLPHPSSPEAASVREAARSMRAST